MEIFTNTRIKISESLTDSRRSYISTIGNLHLGFASMSNQVNIRKLFRDNIDLKNLSCEIVLYCLEKNNENDYMRDGFIRLEGTLSCNKLSRDGWISCHTRISFLKWNQLKNDIQKVTNTFELAYDISDINFGEISENENTIECNIDFGLAAYDLVYTAN